MMEAKSNVCVTKSPVPYKRSKIEAPCFTRWNIFSCNFNKLYLYASVHRTALARPIATGETIFILPSVTGVRDMLRELIERLAPTPLKGEDGERRS